MCNIYFPRTGQRICRENYGEPEAKGLRGHDFLIFRYGKPGAYPPDYYNNTVETREFFFLLFGSDFARIIRRFVHVARWESGRFTYTVVLLLALCKNTIKYQIYFENIDSLQPPSPAFCPPVLLLKPFLVYCVRPN